MCILICGYFFNLKLYCLCLIMLKEILLEIWNLAFYDKKNEEDGVDIVHFNFWFIYF